MGDQLIYGIGGGYPRDPRMVGHFQKICDYSRDAAGGNDPAIALLPTAHRNGVHPGLKERDFILETFSSNGCRVREILVGEARPGESETPNSEVKKILETSDALYVLGGDTRYMLEKLSERGLIPLFKESYEAGLIFSGSSAGLIWLSEQCMSDSESTQCPEHWSFIMLKGIGILPLAINVHDNSGIAPGVFPMLSRREQFELQLQKLGDSPALAVDEYVALEIRDGLCKVISPDEKLGAYLLISKDGKILRRKIEGVVDLFDRDALLKYIRG